MSKCTEKYAMGVFNSETKKTEDISYPCRLESGHADQMTQHEFEKDGVVFKWLDRAQVARLKKN